MGKKKKADSLGRALIRDRFTNRQKKAGDSMLHTSELDDGYDWGRLNLNSVTEESSFDDFLRTAQLAGTEFQAEKLNINFVDTLKASTTAYTSVDREKFERIRSEKKDLIRIPRRPEWNEDTSAADLQAAERESFLEWRRHLSLLQEEEDLSLTPYEKNLDFWRQLWRVVERSQLVVQIVDARNPLLFRCEDLEAYTKETGKDKECLLLLNKADFLTAKQCQAWAKYFDSQRLRCAFFSATAVQNETIQEEEEKEEEKIARTTGINEDEACNGEDKRDENETSQAEELVKSTQKLELDSENTVESEVDAACSSTIPESGSELLSTEPSRGSQDVSDWKPNSSKLLTPSELLSLFMEVAPPCLKSGRSIVGLVGYPNVGKSSTLNSLISSKKVSVSATPGKTKHFQTLHVPSVPVTLCDCPGLVMPSMVATKADMVLYGILPVDQLREWHSPVAAMRALIPTQQLESLYGIMIPKSQTESELSPHPLLNSYAYCRGLMTANGQPDGSRAARAVLKDFVNGRLLHCVSPPGVDQSDFHKWLPQTTKAPPALTPIAARAIQDVKTEKLLEMDSMFFQKGGMKAHTKGGTEAGKLKEGIVGVEEGPSSSRGEEKPAGKPWKDHSHKRNKREKLRRVYRHHDV